MAAVLAVAIINYETPDLTARCAASVQANSASEPTELIVVDNGSNPATLDPLRALDGVRLVETGVNGGFAAGVNRCVAEAPEGCDVVVVLNSDTEVEPGALDALAASAREPGVGLAAPLIIDRNGNLQRSAHRRFPTLATTWAAICLPVAAVSYLLERWLPHPTALHVAEHQAGAEPAHVMGAVMAINRAAWDTVGPFNDERYFLYLEETEWQSRLAAANFRVVLNPAARVRHLHRAGDDAIGVPSLHYLDSARLHFAAEGHRDRTIRAVLWSAVALSYVTLLLSRPFVRWNAPLRSMVDSSLGPARRSLRHLRQGTWLRRPDGRGHLKQREPRSTSAT